MTPYWLRLSLCLFLMYSCDRGYKSSQQNSNVIKELNQAEIEEGNRTMALTGAMLIDGTGREPIPDALVVVRGHLIEYAGPMREQEIPDNADRINISGTTVMPGLIDAHYHNGYSTTMPPLFLTRGITSVRDPGAWNDYYDSARNGGKPIPRLFLTGPHIDMYPPAYPENSYLVKDPEEARLAVSRFADEGATAIKVYFRLPVAIIRAICETAHDRGIPVTGHLEITNARHAIEAGLDGIEHITSFGTCLLPARDVERYKQAVLGDNAARRMGRYEAWSSINMQKNPVVDSLIDFLVERETFVTPTLAVFERQPVDSDSVQVNGFKNMLTFTGMAQKKGVRVVVGSHTWVPYADSGFAYFREMELLQEAGMDPMAIIKAATSDNAEFLRISERLGTISAGKLADMIFIDGDPSKDISLMRNVKRVMLNGVLLPVPR